MTTKRRKRHNPEQIVRKLRDADAMLSRVRGPLCCFRSGYALTSAAQRLNPSTFITLGTGIQSWSQSAAPQEHKVSGTRIRRHELPELGEGIIGSMSDVALKACS
jgi:hypothetical protein